MGGRWPAIAGAPRPSARCPPARSGTIPIVAPPYDTDNNTASFSIEELKNIVAIWRGVAEDYNMFDVSAG